MRGRQFHQTLWFSPPGLLIWPNLSRVPLRMVVHSPKQLEHKLHELSGYQLLQIE